MFELYVGAIFLDCFIFYSLFGDENLINTVCDQYFDQGYFFEYYN